MKVEEIITQRIIDKLEHGTIPWRKPWAGGGMPKNYISRKEYRGINPFMLGSAGYAYPYFLTFLQAKQLGGNIKKGSKGMPVVLFKFVEKENEDKPEKPEKFPVLRYYTVFNIEQTEGIDYSETIAESPTLDDFQAIQEADQIIQNMPNRQERQEIENRAYYSPTRDVVNMPKREMFESELAYYSTFFHELTHSTGHRSRLNRKTMAGLNAFGNHDYSKEELCAEMGAAMLCGHVGIENGTIDNSAAYIAGWLKALRSDKRFVIQAAGYAQKAIDFILSRKFEEND
jgi:antirestriction protein ArdC